MADVPAVALTAVALGLYALHDLLIDNGLVAPGEAAANLRRFGPSGEMTPQIAELMRHVEGVAQGLDQRAFAQAPARSLSVIVGGKGDDA